MAQERSGDVTHETNTLIGGGGPLGEGGGGGGSAHPTPARRAYRPGGGGVTRPWGWGGLRMGRGPSPPLKGAPRASWATQWPRTPARSAAPSPHQRTKGTLGAGDPGGQNGAGRVTMPNPQTPPTAAWVVDTGIPTARAEGGGSWQRGAALSVVVGRGHFPLFVLSLSKISQGLPPAPTPPHPGGGVVRFVFLFHL